jgi:hypothetical protein
VAAFVLGILAIVKGRTQYGVWVIVLSALAPLAGCLEPLGKQAVPR